MVKKYAQKLYGDVLPNVLTGIFAFFLVIRVSLPGYTVPTSFTVGRLWLLDSIYHCLNDVKDNPSLLESIPEMFWSTLTDSFFQFRYGFVNHDNKLWQKRNVELEAESTLVFFFFFFTNF